jgi:hypothetical protein
VRVARERLPREADALEQPFDPLAPRSRRELRGERGRPLFQDFCDPHRGFSDANGSWNTIWMSRRASRSASPCKREKIPSADPRAAFDDRLVAQQLQHRLADRRLAAPRLADERERAPGADRERHAVDRGEETPAAHHQSASHRKADAQRAHFEDRGLGPGLRSDGCRRASRHVHDLVLAEREIGVQQAAHRLAAADRIELRRRVRTRLERLRAARREPAAAERGRQWRNGARNCRERLAALARAGKRLHQQLRVRMARRAKEFLARRDLDDLSGVHQRDPMRHPLHDPEVVRDQQHPHPALLLQPLQQLEDLRLDRHVERGRRLVGDQQVGLGGKRERDHHALLLPARHLERDSCRRGAAARAGRPARAIRSRDCGQPRRAIPYAAR